MTDARPPACRNCRWSEAKNRVLWCILWDMVADRPCKRFQREPGADDE